MAGHVVSVGDLVLDVVLPVTLPVVGGKHQEPAFRRVEPGGAANFLFAARHMGCASRRRARSARTCSGS